MSVTQSGDLPADGGGRGNGNGNGHQVVAPPPDEPFQRPNDEEVGFLAAARGLPAAEIAALWAVRKDMLEYRRVEQIEENRLAYYASKAAMQGEMPIVPRNKPNPNTGKNYSPLEQVVRVCSPTWSKHGFSIGWDVITLENGWLQVICHIDHARGHRETFTNPPAPPDDRGIKGNINKTLVQGNQATVTYAKRGVLCNALGIVTEDEDDDGNSGQSSGDNPHQGHTQKTGSREVERKPPPWREATIRKLENTTTQKAWMATLITALETLPNAGDGLAFWKDYAKPLMVKTNAPKETMEEVHRLINIAIGALKATDGGLPPDSDDPLDEDEQWIQDKISELAGLHGMTTFQVVVQAAKERMGRLKVDKPALFGKANDAFNIAYARINQEASQ